MKIQLILTAVFLGLTALAAGQPSQSVTTSKFVPVVQQSLTGCVDEQFGQYVLLNGEMVKITGLQSAGPNNNIFAKYVGHEVQVKGTRSSGPKATFTVTGIVQTADVCGPAK
jgi:energy-converting hydrogenase Eha subunit A